VTLRTLTAADLSGALALSSLMGWNQRLENWRLLIELAPNGSFVALDEGRVVGTAIGIDYGGFGWIAMMLVHPDHRGRGVGARLLEKALTAIRPGVPVRLDATPLGRPLYERYGFVLETSLTRHVRPANRIAPAIGAASVRPIESGDVDEIARTDRTITGGDRPALIGRIVGEAPEYAWRSTGEGPQYCLGRYGRLFDQIGPIVANSQQTAIVLAGAALQQVGQKSAMIDAYDENLVFVEWLQSAGFEAQRPLYRMRRGGERHAGPAAPTEFAILGPEFG
jgi:GNAT superfamily N-acetyltransferase